MYNMTLLVNQPRKFYDSCKRENTCKTLSILKALKCRNTEGRLSANPDCIENSKLVTKRSPLWETSESHKSVNRWYPHPLRAQKNREHQQPTSSPSPPREPAPPSPTAEPCQPERSDEPKPFKPTCHGARYPPAEPGPNGHEWRHHAARSEERRHQRDLNHHKLS